MIVEQVFYEVIYVFGRRWGEGVKNPLFTRALGDWGVYISSLA